MELAKIVCSICQQGVAWLLPNESERCSTCGNWIRYGEITEHPKTDAP